MEKKKMKRLSNATLLMKHIEQTSKDVRDNGPKWKQVIFMPRKPRNGFKV